MTSSPPVSVLDLWDLKLHSATEPYHEHRTLNYKSISFVSRIECGKEMTHENANRLLPIRGIVGSGTSDDGRKTVSHVGKYCCLFCSNVIDNFQCRPLQ